MPSSSSNPRSIALVGPYGSGKTTLFESLLTAAGSPPRRSGDPRTHAMTTELTLGHCRFMGDAWSFVDCPGSIEFAADAEAALCMADLAVVVCEPAPERALTVAPILRMLEERTIPYLLFVNRIDLLNGRVRDTLAALQAHSRRPLVLRQAPIREGDAVTGYVDVVSERAYRYRRGEPSELVALPADMRDRETEARGSLAEVLADHDDGLLEKILDDVTPTSDEIYRQLHKDQVAGSIVEVLFGAADRGNGVRRLWKALRHDTPDPVETARRRGLGEAGEALVQIFKTTYSGHAGKLSYARIWRGAVREGTSLNGVRIGGIHRMSAGEWVKSADAGMGELVALGRMEGIATGAVLSASGDVPSLPFPSPRPPVYAVAITSENHKDDVKLSGALQRLIEEDPSLTLRNDAETGETILQGQGEIHLNAALDRLARAYALKVTAARPQVPFKETIRRAVSQHSRMKRQTGGHGQFADVKIEIAPLDRGAGFRFKDRIVGGAVPRQYIPAVGDAALDATRKGPFGFPVVDIEVALVDGGFHAVDSSDMAFKSATRMAMVEGLAKADPMLLEPIDHITVTVPDGFTANAQRLLSGHRGQILGYAEHPGWSGWDDVEALVPEAELHDLIIELRSLTMGLGSYTSRFDHLAEARGRWVERATQAAARG